jgi:squalene-hopene/tetraprenyl-beta-curcumene cyclase
MIPADRLRAAYLVARDALLAERVPEGHWVGELSTSALSTATAIMALHLVNPFEHRERIDAGVKWLAGHQNADGGWGDTVKSFSNISTSMLCRAAFKMVGEKEHAETIRKLEAYLTAHAGPPRPEPKPQPRPEARSRWARTPPLSALPDRRAAAIRARYGKDHTFSVPILMTCALAGLVKWDEVPRLPFELAVLPQSWYRFAKMPVVSYALPALIAIGQCVHHHRRSRNPIRNAVRRLARGRTLKVLRKIQPTSGGYLEATPLTSFVTMALASIRRKRLASEQQVIDEGVRFIANSMRPDGSWPIDTNLATWVTTLSVNALASAGDLGALDSKEKILDWLLKQQYKERHPYTGAAPGGWAWTDLPGGVPDCDDTPGAVVAVKRLTLNEEQSEHYESARVQTDAAEQWIMSLQNSDKGFPTFCRGWGVLPFDRSGSDLTAHAIRAIATSEPSRRARLLGALAYLAKQQRADGSWLPLWFGNQHAPDDINPVYGTARVLAAYSTLRSQDSPECRRGIEFLLSVQNADGGWGGGKDCPSSVEETALAVEVLLDLASGGRKPPDSSTTQTGAEESGGLRPPLATERGIAWLIEAVESGRFREASPIGFYFAKLWYFEKLYPLIFTVAALGRALHVTSAARAEGSA